MNPIEAMPVMIVLISSLLRLRASSAALPTRFSAASNSRPAAFCTVSDSAIAARITGVNASAVELDPRLAESAEEFEQSPSVPDETPRGVVYRPAEA